MIYMPVFGHKLTGSSYWSPFVSCVYQSNTVNTIFLQCFEIDGSFFPSCVWKFVVYLILWHVKWRRRDGV